MQVKKFEATTMQEALEMVKNTLGPEAIILNAKDNTGSFGLMGKKSIEVTAAISEKQLYKKQWAEGRLKEQELQKLRSRPAKVQKQFIEKSVNRYIKNNPNVVTESIKEAAAQPAAYRQPTRTRYIEIEDEGQIHSQNVVQARGRTVESVLNEIGSQKSFSENTQNTSMLRVKQAAQSAFNIFESSVSAPETIRPQISSQTSLNEVQSLKNEILQLRSILQNMSQPQKSNITLHPGAEYGVSYEQSATFEKLSQAGISVENILELLQIAQKDLGPQAIRKQAMLEGWIAKTMMQQIQIANSERPIQIFLGPSGSGKSSMLVKSASYQVLSKNKRVGILTCDTEKVGAVDQLRIYSQILNVPFGILKTKEDWISIVDSLRTMDFIFVDYPGLHLKDEDQIQKIQNLLPFESAPCEKHLVLSAGFKDKDAIEIAERYKITQPTDVIFTKLDEVLSHGMIYNFHRKNSLPIHSFGIGPQLPEDFELASRERIVDLIFKITKIERKD